MSIPTAVRVDTDPDISPTRRANRRPRQWRPGRVALLGVALVVLLYPLIWMLSASFKPADEIVGSLNLLPSELTPDNYAAGWQGAGGVPFWQFLVNSTVIATGAVLGNVIACSLAAYAFARLKFRLRGPLFAVMIATILLPFHVTVIPQYVIFSELGLVGTFAPLILPKLLATDAFFIFLLVQFIRGIPRELDEAAALDGCGPFRLYWHILLPLMKPALVTTAIFTFIWTWNDFFSQLIYLSDPELLTVPLGLRLFIDQTSSSALGPMFAMSVVSLLPIVVLFAVFQRQLVNGVANSGLKG
jgi:multiple sugar transport system permease protein